MAFEHQFKTSVVDFKLVVDENFEDLCEGDVIVANFNSPIKVDIENPGSQHRVAYGPSSCFKVIRNGETEHVWIRNRTSEKRMPTPKSKSVETMTRQALLQSAPASDLRNQRKKLIRDHEKDIKQMDLNRPS